jgi:hypothetical protein
LERLLNIFAFLCKHPKLKLSLSRTKQEEFAEIYCNADEQLPHRMPTPRGRRATMTVVEQDYKIIFLNWLVTYSVAQKRRQTGERALYKPSLLP